MNKFLTFQKEIIRCCKTLFYWSCITTALANTATTSAQQTITGTVTDANGPLPDVTITLKNKTTGTVTDFNGEFSITAQPTDILVLSYLGYKTQEIPANNQTIINVKLEEDTTLLQEVVVNAGYYTVNKREATANIATVTAAEIEKQPVTHVLAALQGRMTGVNITQTTGVPGGGFNIQIRGQNSIRPTGNSPLYVVDGVPYATESIGYSQSATIIPAATNPLNSLNPNEIEKIDILKDADATAIYGSRGANGVVLITTKKGKAGKTSFSTTATTGVGQITRTMKLLNTEQYLNMRRQAFANDGVTTYPANAYDVNGTWDENRYTDWQKVLIGGTANFTQLNTAVTGGSENTQMLLNANWHKETTVFPGDFYYAKANVRAATHHKSNDNKFKLHTTVGYTYQDNNQPTTDFTYESRRIAPNAPALFTDTGELNWENNSWDNPLRHLEAAFLSKTYDLMANIGMEYKLSNKLKAKASLGFSDLKHRESATRPSTLYNPSFGLGSQFSGITVTETNRQSWIFEPQLSWTENHNSWHFEGLVGGTLQKQTNTQMAQNGFGFTSNSLIYNLAAASQLTLLNLDDAVYKYAAAFGRLNINWDKKYFLNLTARRDGSSRFGPGNQWGNFGAIGAAWIFSEEKVFNESNILSFGKIRTSYGTSGNDLIGNYQFLNTYATANNNYQGIVGLQPTSLFNPNFGWETNKKFEAALETAFFNNNLALAIAWFNNTSGNQLVGIPLPGTTGFASMQANLQAEVQNRGWEWEVKATIINTKNLNWSSSLNFSAIRNKLLKFPNLANSTYANQLIIGQPLNIKMLYNYLGINPDTGLYQFEDVNGDGIITAAEDRKTPRDFNPKFFGGWHNQWDYKNWQLTALFQFVKQDNWNANYMMGYPGGMSNQSVSVLNAWEQPGDNATHQLYTTGLNAQAVNAFSQFTNATAAVSDASYIRLKNIALYYQLPSKWTGGNQAKLLIQGQNLLTFTKYNGPDPEFSLTGFLPPLKVITAGIQLTF